MSKKINKKSYRLLVVAHPDDETIFFSSVLLNLKNLPWTVICVTNGNADALGSLRAEQFRLACKRLKVKTCTQLNFPDIYEKRLDTEALVRTLQNLDLPSEVYTHSVIGDYGHPHHQDVSFAVHQAFNQKTAVWSLAYNCFADKTLALTAAQYKLKSQVYAEVYQGETLRFAHFLPNHSLDSFCKLGWPEVNEIYLSQVEKRSPDSRFLKKYKWFRAFFDAHNKKGHSRPF
jgi:LmbE family N-acetylglucosaminyl deacetylase